MAVDFEDLSELLESGDLERGAVNLHTGEVWRSTPLEFRALDENGPDLDDLDEWLLVRGQGSRPASRDMERFIAVVDDADVAGRLNIAIDGKGAFGVPRCAEPLRRPRGSVVPVPRGTAMGSRAGMAGRGGLPTRSAAGRVLTP